MEWQHANDGWPSSMATANRRPISRSRCFARITAAPTNCRFACRFIDGAWRNNDSGGTVEATVVGWRLPAAGVRARH